MNISELPAHLTIHGPPVSPRKAARRLATAAIRGDFHREALHTYSDLLGSPIYWRIRARMPNGDKWIRPMRLQGMFYDLAEPDWGGRLKPLYRLPEIAKADPTDVIWYVEGEKCADALANCGLIATTSGGATSDDRADFGPLQGRSVILWPDDDPQGREHMQRMAVRLVALGCRVDTVRIDVLALPEHGDVVDYLQHHSGTTATDLMALARIPVQTALEQHLDEPVELISGDAICVVPVRWLWDGWLARGKLHILAGAPGTGKTTLALAMAATITSGGRWPDGSCPELGSVLIWSGEDDPGDTLAPRLLAMGANMARIRFVGTVPAGDGRRPFDPATDMRSLMTRAAEIPDLRLLIVDPIVNAVAADSHKNGEVRRALAPIVELASNLGCAAIGISHFTKGTAGRDPVERVTGSLAFGALPRVVLVAAKIMEEHGAERRLLARAKSNNSPDGGGYSYALQQASVPGHPEISASRVIWGPPIDGTARELLAEADAAEDAASETKNATDWLRNFLADGPADSEVVRRAADASGYSWATIRRAKKRVGAESAKCGMDKGWVWQICPKVLKNAEDAQIEKMSTFKRNEHLPGDTEVF